MDPQAPPPEATSKGDTNKCAQIVELIVNSALLATVLRVASDLHTSGTKRVVVLATLSDTLLCCSLLVGVGVMTGRVLMKDKQQQCLENLGELMVALGFGLATLVRLLSRASRILMAYDNLLRPIKDSINLQRQSRLL